MENTLIFNGQTLRGDADLLQDLFKQSHISSEKGRVIKYMVLNGIDEYFEAKWIDDSKEEIWASPVLVQCVRACGVIVAIDLNLAVNRGTFNGQVSGFKPFSKAERQARIVTKQNLMDEVAVCSALAKFYQEQGKKYKDNLKKISGEISAGGQEIEISHLSLYIIGDKATYLNDDDELMIIETLENKHMAYLVKRHVEFDGKFYWVYFSPSSEEVVKVSKMPDEDKQGELYNSEQVSGDIVFESGAVLDKNAQLKAFLKFQGFKDYNGEVLQVSAEQVADLNKAISPARALKQTA